MEHRDPPAAIELTPHGTVGEVFAAFLKLGVSSFGGPIAHLGYFRAEFVERRQWLSERAYVDLLRQKGTPYDELGLGSTHWTDGELIDQMLKFPVLINRPIVITPWGVKLCRPSEAVVDILPLPQKGPFAKEDGEPLIDSEGRRVTTI